MKGKRFSGVAVAALIISVINSIALLILLLLKF
jgi:hypothetical protein